MTQRCGVVALIGLPNSGKSTFINHAVGAKVSIVTHKAQTTRTRVRGVALQEECQIVFVDTPGIFASPKRRLERSMVQAAWDAVQDCDLALFMHDANRPGKDEQTGHLLEQLGRRRTPLALMLNKIDSVRRDRLLGLAASLNDRATFEQTFMISAKTGDGVQDVLDWLCQRIPEEPWLYPEDQLSDLSDRLMAAEITREKLFLNLHEELPYSLTVETESWEIFDNGSIRVEQTIYVERDAQKKIAIGAQGATIRKVRSQAQKELETLLETKVHLFLFVKVRERWVDDPSRYREWGLDFDL